MSALESVCRTQSATYTLAGARRGCGVSRGCWRMPAPLAVADLYVELKFSAATMIALRLNGAADNRCTGAGQRWCFRSLVPTVVSTTYTCEAPLLPRCAVCL